MIFCHTPVSSATVSVLSIASRVITRRSLLPKVIQFLFFPLCFLLLLGIGASYGSGVKLVSSDVGGVTLELQIDDLTIVSKEFGDRNYHLISYADCAFTSDPGKLKLPVSHVFIGVPPAASISVNIVDSQFSDFHGYIPPPAPERIQRTSPDGIDMLVDKFAEDRQFYRQNVFYPLEKAAIIYEGYLRCQRIAVIEIHPIQYNPSTRVLRKHSRVVLRVSFSPDDRSSSSGSPLNSDISGSMAGNYQSDREFEKLYRGLLLNYDDARKWRKARLTTNQAALSPRAEASGALKISAREAGIYRLDYAMFLGAGMDLSQVDPRTIKVQLRGKQIPIYIRGEADGRFNEDDYIEFFAARADNIYTRWDVYWLTWGGVRGMRMAQRSGSPDTSMAREITSFKSVARFEEDHLHHKLQDVQPDLKNPEAWFESRDHWFWDGIENGSSKTEMKVDFPVYDLAQSLARPDFRIELVGCTNFEHNIMISVNGYKVGEEAQWGSQDIYQFNGQISSSAFQEGINELRLARIGTNPSDGSNTDNYPYQIYLNWFEIGYIRKLLAVNDSLIFSAPEPKTSDVKEINRYTLCGFLKDDVEIFQITNTDAVCRFKNVAVSRYELDQAERNRISLINSTLGDSTAPDARKVAYRAIFEDQGGQPSRYIAVTSASVLTPERIELDAPSNLKDPSNQADYIIISHPTFLNVAYELADWRSGAMGGGYRTQVVNVTDVYDEFGFGIASPQAIKDFLKFAYHNWAEPAPSYVLIFGDATYDFLGIREEFYEEPPELTAFIPTFYIHTTFGQTAVDHWYSSIDGDDVFADIYLGRIPVEDVSEAEIVLRKIIANESGNVNGAWRKQIISIADDDTHAAGDEQFQIGLEEIWRDHTPPGYDTTRIYLKDIAQQVEQNPLETRRPAEIVEEMIIDAFANKAIIAQYSGHGGRHVWAHEIIFSIVDIENMRGADVYPFILVLSCYNGYFDLPGELSMAEGLLRADGRGIVAMLSATRLTYGSGNVALNKFLFDGIFKEKLLRIGQATAASKTRLLLQEGTGMLNQMQEYTLFGDPASRLNIADCEIHPQLDNVTVAPGGKLDVHAGQAVKSVDGQPGSFDGQVTVTVMLPDGSKTSKTATITAGRYPAMSFDIPAGTAGGQGLLKFYGENAAEVIVGGAKFSISEPSILSVSHELTGDDLKFYAEVSDDAGPSRLKSVTLVWQSHSNWAKNRSPMTYNQQRGVYELVLAILPAFRRSNFSYYVTVEDSEGNSVSTDQQIIRLASKPNLAVLLPTDGSGPSISFGHSGAYQQPGIIAQVKNSESVEVTTPIKIFAFTGNPDQDGDGKVDVDESRLLGKGRIEPEDWNAEGIAIAVVGADQPLSPGKYIVFVWVDPEISGSDDIIGECDEINETDNISCKVLDIAQIVLYPSSEGEIHSSDGVLSFTAPAGAVDKRNAIVIESFEGVLQPFNQPAVSPVALPDSQQGGYSIFSESPDQGFIKPVSLRMRFDLASFTDGIKNEIGLADLSADQLTPEQREILEEILRERISDIAIHRWYDSARKWAHIPSTPVLDDAGNVLRTIHSTVPNSQNTGEGDIRISSIEVDNNITPAGEWVIFFISPERYQLYLRRSGEGTMTGHPLLEKLSSKIGHVEQTYYDDGTTGGGTEIRFAVEQDNFQFGDVLRFTTTESTRQDGSRSLQISNVNPDKEEDAVVNNITIDESASTPVDEWAILFLDPQHFHVQGSKTGVVSKNNEPHIGTLGEEFHNEATGIRFTITSGTDGPGTGHKFKFRTVEVGTVQAALETTGIFSLMLNKDERPPSIQMDIANQNFDDGDIVSSEPTIHALISDDNGVDVLMHGLEISIGRDGEDFEPANVEDYAFYWDTESNDVPVNYWPGKLEPGEYEVKLKAYDFNGNSGTGSIRFVVRGDFKLAKRSLMNYPNPFERETDITFQLSSLAEEAIVKIYTVSGRLIRTLEQNYAVNFVVIHWDGRDDNGEEVANGVYYYKVRLKHEGKKDIVETGKMMKLK